MTKLQLNRSVDAYRQGVHDEAKGRPPGPDVTGDLAYALLAMLDDPGTYTIDDRGGWIEVTRWDENDVPPPWAIFVEAP